MFQETTLMKNNANKKITDNKFQIKIRDISNKFILLLSKTNIKYKIVKQNEIKKLKEHPTIYVVNHYSAQDTPITCNVIDERAYILAGKQNLGFLDNVFFYSNGSIFVDRKDKEDMKLSKVAMEEYLKKNKSIIMFPEGTWNLSDNLLMLNMKWGIIDIALDTDAQIIPINLDYDREKMQCFVKYGDPIIFDKIKEKKELIISLRDTLATMRWEAIERKPTIRRSEINIEDEREQNRKSIEEFPKIDIDYESSVIYKPNPSNQEVFEPIKNLEMNEDNCFLFSKNNKGIY